MTKEQFDDLVVRLKCGDNTALSYLHPYQEDCIRTLVIRSAARCDRDQAYDIFVESLMEFRKNALHDRILFQNIRGYLRKICWNTWLAMARTKARQDSRRDTVTSQLYANHDDPETETTMEELYAERLALMQNAMDQLGERCRTILYMAIADKISMQEIASQMHLANADVAKTTKSRCYKKLLEIIRNTNAS